MSMMKKFLNGKFTITCETKSDEIELFHMLKKENEDFMFVDGSLLFEYQFLHNMEYRVTNVGRLEWMFKGSGFPTIAFKDFLAGNKNKVTNKSRKSIYRKAIKVYGRDKQITKAKEEMAELIVELCKWQLGNDNGKHVQEEIADVIIMMEQMRMLFDVDGEIKKTIAYKVDRLERRLNDERN